MTWTSHRTPGDRNLLRVAALQRDVYRHTGGRVFGLGRGEPMLLLTTTGRRSGRQHTMPLPYLSLGEKMVVVASSSGSHRHPDWYLNIDASPEVTVQVGPNMSAAKATTVTGVDRSDLWKRLVDTSPRYGAYQQQSERVLPVVAITPEQPVGHGAPAHVERPALGWWVSILSGMTLLGLVASNDRTWRWWSTHMTAAIPRSAFRSLFRAAVATHIVESAIAVRVAERDGRHAATLAWGAQALLLGYPSLGLLRRSATARNPPTQA